MLGLLFAATRGALGRALRPLEQIMRALDRTGRGRFDTRLPLFATPELGSFVKMDDHTSSVFISFSASSF